uniref:ATP-grasp domain-containing protein n=1 Tax=Alexandrium monilatum TaxID=311494 RepID=A0A7S4SP54_9DINO
MAPPQAVVIVDPLSTGCSLALEAASRGYSVIALWDGDLPQEVMFHTPASAKSLHYHAVVHERATVEETAAAVLAAAGNLGLAACIAGAEPGVSLADALSQELGLRTNGISAARRNKWCQQESVRSAGLRAVRQACGSQWCDLRAFVEAEPMPIIVKPAEGAGSDGVRLCRSPKEAEAHVRLLAKRPHIFGLQNKEVLCQEFLRGREYVVDHVSRDGEHKTMMVWVYDKRPANGAEFVEHGMLPVNPGSAVASKVIHYARAVLDALGIRNGPSHGEVIMTQTGPCLVEMNCRTHGGDGAWLPLARALTGGYTQVDATMDAFLDEEAFQQLPEVPPNPLRASGLNVELVSFKEGLVKATPGLVSTGPTSRSSSAQRRPLRWRAPCVCRLRQDTQDGVFRVPRAGVRGGVDAQANG